MHEYGIYFEPNWRAVILDKDIGKMEWRVLILASTGWTRGNDNTIPYTQQQMAQTLEVSRQAVHAAMRTLVRKGLIFQTGQTYQLNSRLATYEWGPVVFGVRQREAQNLRMLEAAAQREADHGRQEGGAQ